MQNDKERRPDPDALLRVGQKPTRGRLKLFLGAAPGVGKTFAMLTEAHEKRREGLDVLIGWVDTHGRRETAALLKGLEVLPRQTIQRGTFTTETLDIDAIIRRRPALVVIDELPHSNPPNARHLKRWQDIEDILDVGIDVYSAMNIQHLESLNDMVGTMTGVDVKETIPDRFFDEADEVRLVDLPPDDLLKRLEAGKIYLPGFIERAKNHFFRKANLIALRELSLRLMADRLETEIREHRSLSTDQSVRDASFGLLLVIESPDAHEIIREAGRLARSLAGNWHVLWLDKPGESRKRRRAAAETLAFAESLGAVTAMATGHFGREVSAYAREHNLSMIASADTGLYTTYWRRRELRRRAPEVTFVILSSTVGKEPLSERLLATLRAQDEEVTGYAITSIVTILLTGLFSALIPWIQPTNFAMCYLLVSFIAAIRYGLKTAAYAVVLSIICFDLVAVEPLGSFAVSDLQYVFTFFVMLTVGIVAARLVAKRETIAREAREREAQMGLLYETASAFATYMDRETLYRQAHEVLTTYLDIALEIWEPDDEEGFRRMTRAFAQADPALMRLAVDHQRPTGRATTTLGQSEYLYVPLKSSTGDVLAVAVLRLENNEQWTDALSRRLIDALLTLLGQAIERLSSQDEARESLANLENERLRHSLVRSLSHDLKTPLTTLTLGAESVLEKLKRRDHDGAFDETVQLIKSSERMSRLVTNMLDMAKLQSGSFKPNMAFFPADELVSGGLGLLKERLRDFKLDIKLQPDCPLLFGDQVLLERLLFNLLDNAVKYCPFGSRILIEVTQRNQTVMVAVHDNGPGLPAGDPQKLFDPFRRGQKESKIAGVGLGLAICRSIARAHNADLLALPSTMGGASFILMLPYVEPPAMDDEESILAQLEE
ncbi:MAG: sensor histidine kinase KdpD [Sutterella wadsworthensis]|nr:sensor histidine kinase KdpD [Sutterella wadsworthensis]